MFSLCLDKSENFLNSVRLFHVSFYDKFHLVSMHLKVMKHIFIILLFFKLNKNQLFDDSGRCLSHYTSWPCIVRILNEKPH